MEYLARREMTMRRKAATAIDRLMVILSAGFLAWLAFIAVKGDVEWNGSGDYPTAVEAIDRNAKAHLNGVADLPD
jgi:hypothetical protein